MGDKSVLIDQLADMPGGLDLESAVEWVRDQPGLMEWLLWAGRNRYLVREVGGVWSGSGKVRMVALPGRPRVSDKVMAMELTGFQDGCLEEGEGLRAICRRLSAWATGQGVPMSAGGTARRLVYRLAEEGVLEKTGAGLYVRGKGKVPTWPDKTDAAPVLDTTGKGGA